MQKIVSRIKILTLPSLYIYQLIKFVNRNEELYLTNNKIHKHNSRHNKNLHQPVANFTQYQYGVLHKGTKKYNRLPLYIKK